MMDPVDQGSPEVPLEVHEFVQELTANAEAIHKKNTDLREQICSLKKKFIKMQECEKRNHKQKLEMLKLFRRFLEERKSKTATVCKICPSLQSDLVTVKRRISNLLDEQAVAEERLWDLERDIKRKKVIEESKIHENKEFEQQCLKRKADVSRHFFRSKFEACWLRNEIKHDLGLEESEEYVCALQEEVTEIVMKKALDGITEKIIAYEREAYFEALEEVTEEIAKKDQIVSKKQERGYDPESSSDEETEESKSLCEGYDSESSSDEETEEEKYLFEGRSCRPTSMDEKVEKARRARSMEQIYKSKTHI